MTDIAVITKDTAKRLIKDIKQMKNDPIDGIYYTHDEANILQGYALIIGPADTPYEGGYYLFMFEFPSDYPYSPPKLKYCTNDGNTRMHPNLYKNGKVCLSILNTWNGDSWTGCQSISSVLLTIRSIMTTDPLLHEPGITNSHRDFATYTEIIRYKNISLAMIGVIKTDEYVCQFGELISVARKDFVDNYEKKTEILCRSKTLYDKNETRIKSGCVYTSIYNMTCKIDYDAIACDMERVKCVLIGNYPKK